ncbi:hypothetical protein [Paraburkholderia atlantica]|uniref:Uncharacterized protein n=1 Tax=Paraburkholderia atlantica TaxID=2654982 RepID=D5WNK5_PARAM|nr:hypothetical protein [Paraburkholderia atlantica]ADG20884.1 conserved hypothetical protein [Paraburkholderia atlantica]MBB5511044.1 hypothetical protein [Paraburkholderia atlantica]
MEHLVRVQNERDRRTLAWLRGHVGDAAIVAAVSRYNGPAKPYLSTLCRLLGVTAPPFGATRRSAPSAAAERSLTAIRQILASANARRAPVDAPPRRP